MTTLNIIKEIAEQGCIAFTCEECPLKKLCNAMGFTGVDMDLLAKELLNLLSYDSDMSQCEEGDWVWEQRYACWLQIISIDSTRAYPVMLEGGLCYTLDGRLYKSHKFPLLFVKPPLGFNPEPKPETESPFKIGDKVWVRDNLDEPWKIAIYCRYNTSEKHKYVVYAYDKLTLECWKYCKKAEEE